MQPPPLDGTDEPEGAHRPRLDQLHDLISLGEIESALSASSAESDADTGLGIRLPLLLRWLTAAQPLATISPSQKLENSSGSNIVEGLEDVAAAHHNAENIEVLVSSLAPAICKEVVGKRPPISRKKPDSAFLYRQSVVQQDQADCDVWDTNVLDKALHRLSKQEQPKRKREGDQSTVSDNNKKQKSASNDEYLEKMKSVIDVLEQDLNNDDEDIGVEQEEEKKSSVATTSAVNGRDDTFSSFFERASSDDSHISSMRRVLHELIFLVKTSLNSNTHDDVVAASTTDEDGHGDSTQMRGANKSPWISTKPDSLLAETDTITSGGFGLPVMISALMHYAPILRYRHVSSALCRASVPQSSTLIMHMAANCPAASSCLLRGCIDAYTLGRKYQSLLQYSSLGEEEDMDEKAVNIIHTSVASVKALASLSCREACNVVRVLRECGNQVMSSLVLKILLDIDEAEAASFIVEILSSSLAAPTTSTTASSNEVNPVRRQSLGKRRSLPLNQRMIRNYQLHSENEVQACTLQLDTSHAELLEDEIVTEAALSCMSRSIIQQSRTVEEQFCLGEASLYIQAYALLTYFMNNEESSSKYDSVEETISAIHTLSKFITQSSPRTGLAKETTTDEFYTILLCTTLFAIVQISASKDSFNTQTAEKACIECIQLLLLHPVSMNTTVVAARIANYVNENNTMHLLRFSLQSTTFNGVFAVSDEKITTESDVCQWLSSRFESEVLELVQNKVMAIEYVLHDATVFVEKMSQMDSEQSSELEQTIQTILDDPDKCCQMVQQSTVCDFIRGSAQLTCRTQSPHIPLVLPLALEQLSRKLWSDIGDGKEGVSSNCMQFVLQLLYALSFLDVDPTSPFVINPRLFPLKESLDLVDRLKHSKTAFGSNGGALILHKTLKEHILQHCPDLIETIERNKWLIWESERFAVSHQGCIATPLMVCDAINDCLQQSTKDPSGVRAEELFLASRSIYPSATVDIATIGTILASSSNRYQPKFVSYDALCKDPLILLKARAAVWKFKGLRRIMIRMLCDLMSANESITIKDSASQSAALRYLTARDTVIFRCLLFACASTSFLSSNVENSSGQYMMCVSLMRSIASRRRGVIATLVKQGLPQSSIDFLVRFIPESFQDASELMLLLGEKDAVPLVERLMTASTALSICVANSSRGESTAKKLLAASLDTFIDGFHLVIGPLGLPVSVFRDEENGQDITLMCKEATFQMITTLSTINPRSILKKDAIIYLTRIANLCKSENTVGGVSERKNLLKGIRDRCDSSCRSLGGSLR